MLRRNAVRALNHLHNHPPACPCHACSARTLNKSLASLGSLMKSSSRTAPVSTEYAFEMAASNIRYGPGVTREVGADFVNRGISRVAVFTDPNLAQLPPVATALESLDHAGVKYVMYKDVMVEPKESGVRHAVDWARNQSVQGFLAVGGGSVMDYAKVANLMTAYPEADLMDFVNAPLGKGLPILKKLLPLIAVPTTAGTGSETTGTAIFDLPHKRAKTGIASRALKPDLGIVDPEHSQYMSSAIRASSGLDVFCHSLESYTAIPYTQRSPRPLDPKFRPAYQGSNPIADIFSLAALRMVVQYLPRSVHDPQDVEARDNMMLAATLAGIGFGNAGVHLCHGLSYPISSQNRLYQHPGYQVDHPIIPHGVSVAVTAPAVFRYTAPSNPDRHLQLAEVLGADISQAKAESAGELMHEYILRFLDKLGDQPKGLEALGFGSGDLDALVKGALPQRRVLDLAPQVHASDEGILRDALYEILEASMKR